LTISSDDLKNRHQLKLLQKDLSLISDGIITYQMSNLALSLIKLSEITNYILSDCKKHIITIKEDINTSLIDQGLFTKLLQSVARVPSSFVLERTKIGRIRVKERGGKLGGPYKTPLDRKYVETKLYEGLSPEKIGKNFSPPTSGSTIRRRMKEWGIYNDYMRGEFTNMANDMNQEEE
jgi:DNA invertase Pin-like site-specific DNA recombinase